MWVRNEKEKRKKWKWEKETEKRYGKSKRGERRFESVVQKGKREKRENDHQITI